MLVHPVSPLRVLRGSRQEFLGWTPVSVKLRVPPRQSRGNSHFIRMRTYPAVDNHCCAAPNADTLYTEAWLDVSKEPSVLSIPDMGNRYYIIPMLDGYPSFGRWFSPPFSPNTCASAASRNGMRRPIGRTNLPSRTSSANSRTLDGSGCANTRVIFTAGFCAAALSGNTAV